MKKILAIIACLVLGLFLLGGCTAPAEEGEIKQVGGESAEAVKVGVMVPLTGDAASYGESVKAAAEFALAESGANLELVYEDSKCDGKEAVTAVNKLISVDGVQAIVGELCSGATLAAAPIAEQHGVVMVSPASTSPEVTNVGDYLFRTVPSDALQGNFGANLVYEMEHRALAVLYVNDDYGVGFNAVLRESFPALGGEVVASEAIEKGSLDVRTSLTKIKDSGADSLYIITNSPDSAVAALKQIKELGLEVVVFGSEGLKADYVTENAGEAAEGLIVTSVSTGNDDFVSRYKEAGNELGPFAAQGYDALKAIALAVESGASTGATIKDELDGMSFEGVSGTITFDGNGDITGNYEVYEVISGEFVAQ